MSDHELNLVAPKESSNTSGNRTPVSENTNNSSQLNHAMSVNNQSDEPSSNGIDRNDQLTIDQFKDHQLEVHNQYAHDQQKGDDQLNANDQLIDTYLMKGDENHPMEIDGQTQTPQNNFVSENAYHRDEITTDEAQNRESNFKSLPTINTQIIESDQGDSSIQPQDSQLLSATLPSNNHKNETPFATPLKSLPPLKDIEQISTPRVFAVAKDGDSKGPDLFKESSATPEELEAASGYLEVSSEDLKGIEPRVVRAIAVKSSKHLQVLTELNFLNVQSEQIEVRTTKQTDELRNKLTSINKANNKLQEELDSLRSVEARAQELTYANTALSTQLQQAKANKERLESELSSINETRDLDVVALTTQVLELTLQNIEQAQRINELTRELNNVGQDLFSVKLEAAKQANTVKYLTNQKEWYEAELSKVQERYTDLLKKHETQYLTMSTENAQLSAQVEGLRTQLQVLREQNKQVEAELATLVRDAKARAASARREVDALVREMDNQRGLLELTQKQVEQRNTRVAQLEAYTEELRNELSGAVTEQDAAKERVVELEEKLARAEEAFGESSDGQVNLPRLHTEFHHVKKQLEVERRQKEVLSTQLAQFVAELDAKKPALASYRDQINEYEQRVRTLVQKVEVRGTEKSTMERELQRTRAQFIAKENELVQMKQLLRDVGRQLCFFLLHAHVRDNHEDPLTVLEKRAIENILDRTGNNGAIEESDADKLVSERMLEFKNVVELRERNEELLKSVRLMTRKLEEREDDEGAAVSEAKEAIMTLQGELARLEDQLGVVTSERDLLREKQKEKQENVIKVNENTEKEKKNVEKETENVEKKRKVEDLAAQADTEILNVRIHTLERTLADLRAELALVSKNLSFWKEQTAKLEQQLVTKLEALRNAEAALSRASFESHRLEQMKELAESTLSLQKAEAVQLRADKAQLNDFIVSLQSLLRDRDTASQQVSQRLDTSIAQYQELHSRLAEKDEIIARILREKQERNHKESNKVEQKTGDKDDDHKKSDNVDEHKVGTKEGDANQADSLVALDQMTELARATEEALAAATAQFESHKADLESRTTVLASERDRLQKVVQDLEIQLKQTRDELAATQNQVSTSAGEMKADYERKLQSLSADLNAQVQLASDHQRKYQLELQRNHELAQRAAELRESEEKLQSEILRLTREVNGLVSAEERAHLERGSMEDELKNARSALEEMRAQNALLAGQIEAGGRGDDEMAQVVGFLRKEKEAVEEELRREREKTNEAKIAQAKIELQDSAAALRPATFSLEKSSTSSSLELNILRESNSTLRREANEYREQAEELGVRAQKVSEELDALRSEHSKLNTELEVAQQRVRLVEETNKRLSSSSPGADDSNAVAAMREKYNDLRTKANSKLALQNETIVKLRESVDSLTAELDKIKKEHEKKTKETAKYTNALTQEKNQLVMQLAQLRAEKQKDEGKVLEEKKRELEEKQKEVEEKQKEVEEKEKEVEKKKKEVNERQKGLEEKEKAVDEKQKELNEKGQENKPEDVARLEARISELDQQLKAVGNNSDQAQTEEKLRGYEKEIAELKQKLESQAQELGEKLNESEKKANELKEKVETEGANAKARVEKLYEMKMKMLNKKVERLEKAKTDGETASSGAPQAATTTAAPAPAPATSTGFGSNGFGASSQPSSLLGTRSNTPLADGGQKRQFGEGGESPAKKQKE